jgi:two-component system, NtrC family, response regulator AtoC
LRVIQAKEVERLGGTQTTKVDVRFLAATHRELSQMVERGQFRQDLFYRLNVIRLIVPSLRERPEDIALLARHFCRAAAETNTRPGFSLDEAAVQLLLEQPWPGNVRQLENFIERLVVLSDGPQLTCTDVQRELARDAQQVSSSRVATPAASEPKLDVQRKDAERKAISDALQRAAGNRTLASRLLGISRRTLYTKLAELDLLDAGDG